MSNAVGRNIARGCGIGCGGIMLLVILAVVASQLLTTPEMRAQMKKSANAEYAADQASRKATAATFFKSVSDLSQRLPDVADLKEQRATPPCVPLTRDLSDAPYMAVDYDWFRQFTDHGFVPAKPVPNPPPWYRDTAFSNIETQAVPAEGMLGPDYEGMLGNVDDVNAVPYIAVIQPLEQSWPTLSGDGKSFQGGLFRGWLILVDGKTEKPIGETEFTAASSKEIQSFRVGVHNQMLLGDDLKTAMEKDFTDHFWQAATASVARICGQEGKADFASHEPNFVRPGS
jgi:hypothetical protein